MQFLIASLDTLANNLEDTDFQYLLKEFPGVDLKSLNGKDIWPYEWMNSIKKFKHVGLPPKEAFYSSLNANQRGKGNGHISDEDYKHGQDIWKIFKFKTFKDYHDHYLKNDVLMLTDVFANFINLSLKDIKLDPSHYYSAPGLSWDTILKMTEKH